MSLGVGALSVPFAWLPPVLESVPVGVGLRLADGSLVHVALEDSTEFRHELAYVYVSPSTYKEHEIKCKTEADEDCVLRSLRQIRVRFAGAISLQRGKCLTFS